MIFFSSKKFPWIIPGWKVEKASEIWDIPTLLANKNTLESRFNRPQRKVKSLKISSYLDEWKAPIHYVDTFLYWSTEALTIRWFAKIFYAAFILIAKYEQKYE